MEQKSIINAVEYEYLTQADITDCYGSIYTHSIAWALHSKVIAKSCRRDNSLIGNKCDWFLQRMSNGQTNGIPQGSVLSDLFAELLLGYIDSILLEKIDEVDKKLHFEILRFRDDYRIFTDNQQVAEIILKLLTEVLLGFGLKLNTKKTSISSNVIKNSIKDDKLSWLCKTHQYSSIQKNILGIYLHSLEFNNAGSLVRALSDYFLQLKSNTWNLDSEDILPIISILVDIAYNNPRTVPIVAAIISCLFDQMNILLKKVVFKKIQEKFFKKPNTGFLQIWLQRMVISQLTEVQFSEPLCQIVKNNKISLWNVEWITNTAIKKLLNNNKNLIDKELLKTSRPVIDYSEVALFINRIEEY